MLTPELQRSLAAALGLDQSELRRRLAPGQAAAWLDSEMEPGTTLTPYIGVPQRAAYYIDDTQAIWTVDDIERASAEETKLQTIMRREHAKARRDVPDEQYACLDVTVEGDAYDDEEHRGSSAPWREDPWGHDVQPHFAVFGMRTPQVNKIIRTSEGYVPYPFELEQPEMPDFPLDPRKRRHFEGPGHLDWSRR